jgi:hypothetical protein
MSQNSKMGVEKKKENDGVVSSLSQHQHPFSIGESSLNEVVGEGLPQTQVHWLAQPGMHPRMVQYQRNCMHAIFPTEMQLQCEGQQLAQLCQEATYQTETPARQSGKER